MTVTQNDILAALAAAVEAQESKEGVAGVTAAEYAAARGCDILKARGEIKKLLASGEAESVRVLRLRMDGVVCPVPGYRPKP